MYATNNPEQSFQNSPPHSPQLVYNKILTEQVGEAKRSKQESRMKQIYMNQMYQEKQRQSFPFGKERDKIANYVVNQLTKDEQNNQILEKFRLQAIRNRNQKVLPHVGTQPYLTQSMLPGASVDPSKLIQKIVPPALSNYPAIRNQSMQNSIVKKSHTLNYGEKEKRSIGVVTEDVYLARTSRKGKKKQKQREFRDIYEEDEEESFHKIKNMLNSINSKIKQNTSTLNQSMHRQNASKKANFFKTPKRKIIHYQTEEEQQRKPKIQYSFKNRNRLNTEQVEGEDMSEVKKHLQLLKKNRKRLYNLYQQGKK